MAPFPSEDAPLYTAEELAEVEKVRKSRLWRLITDALCYRREQLFSATAATSNDLWKQKGAIEEIQALLQRGPLLVVEYQRYMKANQGDTSPPNPIDRKMGDDETPSLEG